MSYKFPENFFWGTATAAHQVEGGLKNNWTEWEIGHSKKFSEKYLKERPWFVKNDEIYKEMCDPKNYISGKACDSFHRYEDDVRVMKELGLNSYRFSLSWSRIEPEKGCLFKGRYSILQRPDK